MEKKLTPVEWLHNRLQTEPFLTNEDFEKAKAMEAERLAPLEDDTEQFALYVHESRNKFVKDVWETCPDAKQRVVVEDILICFDQMHERLNKRNQPNV